MLALALPALLRWPLVLCPLYALVVAVVFVVLFLAWRDGSEKTEKRRTERLRVIRGHRS